MRPRACRVVRAVRTLAPFCAGAVILGLGAACAPPAEPEEAPPAAAEPPAPERRHLLERVGDAAVAQLYADGFAALDLREKVLIWHLYNAALAGRDIFYDQRYAHNLEMREVLEEILTHAEGVDPAAREAVHRYTKLFWINTGPYNNLTARKFTPDLDPAAFREAARAAEAAGARFPTRGGETLDALLDRLEPVFFDATVDPILTNKSPAAGDDMLLSSANNLYDGVAMADLDGFEERYPLNSRLVKRAGRLEEEVYRIDGGGRYAAELAEVVRHLEAAVPFATEPMAAALEALITWHRTGEPADRRAYDVAWVADQASPVDTINGFTEVYMDARGAKGSWEALVYYVNEAKTEAIRTLAEHAQWFEDRMPWDPRYRKEGVRGVTANAIDVVVEVGDAGPITPIGINLPNDQTVREQHGSKSISLSNVIEAYELSQPAAYRAEFTWDEAEAARADRWGRFAGDLTTNMHEVIGHASGQLAERLGGNAQPFLREQYSALEEARADLVALYFIADPKLVEIGIVDAADHADVALAEYEAYARNAILQLRRVREGSQLEQDHMRNRQMVVHWLIDNTDAVEVRRRDGRTHHVVTDAGAFREGVGRLLAEVQRIKSEGDYDAARALFEAYGIRFDPALRDEVLERVARVDLPSYTGFVMPRLEAVTAADGSIADVVISYPQDLTQQMLEYSGKRAPPAAEPAASAADADRAGEPVGDGPLAQDAAVPDRRRADDPALLVDLFTAAGDAALARYRARRSAALLAGGGAAGAALFALRDQQEPAAPLPAPFYAGLYPLRRDAPPPPAPGPLEGVSLIGSAVYARLAVYGEPAPAGEAQPAAMLVLSHPTDLGHDAAYNAWYTDNHMIDVARSPHFRAATRYAPRRQLAGAPLSYLCVYEIAHPYSPELHQGVMRWLTETPDDFRQPMPETPAGQGVLTLDLWGYFERVWSTAG